MNEKLGRGRSFEPVADADTRLLILGSLPGVKSLHAQQYYANPGNAFWSLVGEVIGEDLKALPYQTRLQALRARRIGLWDMIADAERVGSLDSAIRNARSNDLVALAKTLPSLTTLAFNGMKSAKVGLGQLRSWSHPYRTITLLSSSGACAVRSDVKRENWMQLRCCL